MTDYRTVLERDLARVGPAPFGFDDVARRRDRKRRNQRITAGVVGIAVFVSAVWIVTSGSSLDQSETPAVPGPAETGATITIGPRDAAGLVGVPPSGAVPSTPEESRYVLAWWAPHNGWVILYTDGRVIWTPDGGAIYEMRLSLAGVKLFRSAPVSLKQAVFNQVFYQCPGVACVSSLPANAWEDAEITAWVPSKYAICYLGPRDYIEPSRVVGLLPAPAQALLDGKERKTHPDPGVPDPTTEKGYTRPPVECSEVTTEQARALDEILRDAGFEGNAEAGYSFVGPDGDWVQIGFHPILPHGTWVAWDTSEARPQE